MSHDQFAESEHSLSLDILISLTGQIQAELGPSINSIGLVGKMRIRTPWSGKAKFPPQLSSDISRVPSTIQSKTF